MDRRLKSPKKMAQNRPTVHPGTKNKTVRHSIKLQQEAVAEKNKTKQKKLQQ